MTEDEPEDPRVTRNRRAVHAAALELLAAEGVAGLTVDRLAEVSGVSRSTIYRRWSDVGDLILAAYDEIVHAHTPAHRDGDVLAQGGTSADLLNYLRDYARRLNDPQYVAVVIAIMEWSWRDPGFAAAHDRMFAHTRSTGAAILREGQCSGELPEHLAIADGVEALVAPFLYRRLVLHREISESDVAALHANLMRQWQIVD